MNFNNIPSPLHLLFQTYKSSSLFLLYLGSPAPRKTHCVLLLNSREGWEGHRLRALRKGIENTMLLLSTLLITKLEFILHGANTTSLGLGNLNVVRRRCQSSHNLLYMTFCQQWITHRETAMLNEYSQLVSFLATKDVREKSICLLQASRAGL